MKRLLLSVACSFILCTAALAQQGQEKKPVKGTYQIEVHNIRSFPYLPANLEQMVLDARKPDKTNYIIISDYVKIRVLPESAVNHPNFVPIREEVIYQLN